jgi:hypothetical protein
MKILGLIIQFCNMSTAGNVFGDYGVSRISLTLVAHQIWQF